MYNINILRLNIQKQQKFTSYFTTNVLWQWNACRLVMAPQSPSRKLHEKKNWISLHNPFLSFSHGLAWTDWREIKIITKFSKYTCLVGSYNLVETDDVSATWENSTYLKIIRKTDYCNGFNMLEPACTEPVQEWLLKHGNVLYSDISWRILVL